MRFVPGTCRKRSRCTRKGSTCIPTTGFWCAGHAVALNEAGRPNDTLKLIDEYGQLHAIDPEMYRLRADANGKLGRTLDSQADLAEHYYLSGRLDQAIHQLRAATQGQDRDQDFYRIARIEARLKELEG